MINPCQKKGLLLLWSKKKFSMCIVVWFWPFSLYAAICIIRSIFILKTIKFNKLYREKKTVGENVFPILPILQRSTIIRSKINIYESVPKKITIEQQQHSMLVKMLSMFLLYRWPEKVFDLKFKSKHCRIWHLYAVENKNSNLIVFWNDAGWFANALSTHIFLLIDRVKENQKGISHLKTDNTKPYTLET